MGVGFKFKIYIELLPGIKFGLLNYYDNYTLDLATVRSFGGNYLNYCKPLFNV